MVDLQKLAQAMCSIDLPESNWTQELPRLPVPDLWLTVSRYLASLKAVLDPAEGGPIDAEDSDERRKLLEANRMQFKRTDELVEAFMLNEGPQLQRDLKEYANKCQNWATEYWLQDMYLSNPLPLPINSNPFFMFPRQQFETSQEMLMFATRVIQFSVDFKYRIDQQTLKQDFGSGHGRGKPLCMETYKNFFHSYRMPHEDMDRLLPQSRRSNHIVVASCNQFFILRLGQDPLDNPYRKDVGSQLNEASIFDQLLCIYRSSRENARREHSANQPNRVKIPKVGLLTTENRKTWAKLHKRLSHCNSTDAQFSAGPNSSSGSSSPNTNTESLRQIEDCLFVMCLDSFINSDKEDEFKCGSESGEFDARAAGVILSGAGSHLFTANRWFDKFLQIIVGRNGICGINIEHSASEGITVLRFLEEFLNFIRSNPVNLTQSEIFKFGDTKQIAQEPPEVADSLTSPGYVELKSPSALLRESSNITPLNWVLDEPLEAAIQEAEVQVDKLIGNFSLKILNFAHFGRAFIKNQNLSPDAFVQLALQYTFFKLHKCLVSTYESASLRQFRLGRVDNIRANTCEAFNWIRDMLRCESKRESGTQIDWRPAEASFIKAITKQVEILRYTILGGGPDNHLLALRQLAKLRYHHDEMPQLFTDPSYRDFLNFRLSTSQLPNNSGITVGYGAVVPDGYGCSYNPRENCVVFCVSSFADCPETSSSRFVSTLSENLLSMQQLCLGRAKQRAS